MAVDSALLVREDVPGETEQLERALNLVQVDARRGDGSFAPVLIPRNVTSCTEPTAETTMACLTPAA